MSGYGCPEDKYNQYAHDHAADRRCARDSLYWQRPHPSPAKRLPVALDYDASHSTVCDNRPLSRAAWLEEMLQ